MWKTEVDNTIFVDAYPYNNAIAFSLFSGAEPQGNTPVAEGPHYHISAKKGSNLLSIIAFM